MHESVQFGQKILVGIDGSPNSAAAMAWAIDQARSREASVEAVYVWQIPSLSFSAPGYIPMGEAEIEDIGGRLLEKVLSGIDSEEVKVNLRVAEGAPVSVLVREAQAPDIALVVVGARGHSGVAGLLLGSVSHALTHHCPKPLAIVPEGWNPSDPGVVARRIVVGVNGSRDSERALAWAISDAAAKNTPLEAVMVWSTPSPVLPAHLSIEAMAGADPDHKISDSLRDAVARVDSHGVDIDSVVLQGHPSHTLIERARSAQVLVLGTRGLGRARESITGSVSHTCTHHATVPVVVVP